MKRVVLYAIAFLMAACSGKSNDKQAQLQELKKQRAELNAQIAKLEADLGQNVAKTNIRQVAVQEVTPGSFSNFLEIQGKVDADQNVQANPEAPGVVTAVHVQIGQRVNRGQVLAQLDNRVLQQSLAELQTQLNLANNLYQRQKNLWDQQIGTEVQYLNAKAQKESIEKRIATVRSQASMYRITAPISGTVDAMDLKIGQAVQPGFSGIRIVNTSNLKAKAMVAESYAGKINSGDPVNVILPDLGDTIRTRVTYAAKTIDPASRSFNVEVKLPGNRNYSPNMIALLQIIDYKSENALTIPVNAIQKSEAGDYVYTVVNGKARRVAITAGKISGGVAEVLLGLKAGDKVVVAGMQELNDGDAVKL